MRLTSLKLQSRRNFLDVDDTNDEKRLEQTHLEQVNANASFRTLVELFAQVRYSHLFLSRYVRPNGL